MGPLITAEPGTPLTPKFVDVIFRGVYTPTAPQVSVEVLNVLQLVRQSGPAVATPLEIATYLAAHFDTSLKAAFTNKMSINTWEVRWADSPTFPWTILTSALTGTRSTETLPSYSTVTCRKLTAVRGRNYRGSIHFAGVAEEDTVENNLDGGGVTIWDAVNTNLIQLCTPFVVGGGGDTFQLAILSPTLSNRTANPCVFTGATCTGALLNTQLGTARHRKGETGS